MRIVHKQFPCLALAVALLAGCKPSGSETVVEGTIWSVEYKLEDGRTGGFTRLNDSRTVPGRNGSWNVDAHGWLTRDFLVITFPQRKELGPRVIPAHIL